MTLTDILSRTRCLLIDFDGPICSVFAGHPATTVAAQLLDLIRDRVGTLPPHIAELEASPLQILRQVADLGDDELTRAVADACRDAETIAVASATPTLGAEDVLRAAHDAGLSIVIVSNNASTAIEAYLHRRDLAQYFDAVAARTDDMGPQLLKPHPFLVEHGLTVANAQPDEAAFIGDSTTDIEAGNAAGTATIGYANKPGKHQHLADAEADAVIDAMTAIVRGLQLAQLGTTK